MRILLLAAVLFTAPAAPALADTRNFGLTAFDRIVVEGDYQVDVVPAPPTAARATGPRRALEALSVEVMGRTLRIRNRDRAAIRSQSTREDERDDAVVIRISTPPPRSITLAGAGTVSVARMAGLNTEIILRGPGSVRVARADGDRLAVMTEGSGTVALAGRVKTATLSTKGTPTIDAAALATDDLLLDAEGMGTIAIEARRSARITARGQSRIDVTGAATCVVRNLGSGAVRCGKGD